MASMTMNVPVLPTPALTNNVQNQQEYIYFAGLIVNDSLAHKIQNKMYD